MAACWLISKRKKSGFLNKTALLTITGVVCDNRRAYPSGSALPKPLPLPKDAVREFWLRDDTVI
jgi:hypothetical protein